MMKSFSVVVVVLCAVALACADESAPQPTNYAEVAAAVNETMRTYHYDPAELDTVGYKRIEAAITDLAEVAESDEDFVAGFSDIWKNGPFSHVEFRTARQSADDIAAYLDNLRVGGGGATLAWQGDVAILTVNTMMGLDTIEEIDAAYVAIANRGANGLIIDLRENGGGAFAVRPLVAHLLNEAVDGGSFVSQRWNAAHNRAPNLTELEAVAPWEGWSIRAFWADVQDAAITRFSIAPVDPVFVGPVYVLTSKRTASAAELATDVLQSSGRALVIGENTAGQMLSQKIFDVPGGFHLSLPVADYYSIRNGRIEGVGVKPDIEVDAVDALNIALQRL